MPANIVLPRHGTTNPNVQLVNDLNMGEGDLDPRPRRDQVTSPPPPSAWATTSA